VQHLEVLLFSVTSLDRSRCLGQSPCPLKLPVLTGADDLNLNKQSPCPQS
jgi:hypothetical protein